MPSSHKLEGAQQPRAGLNSNLVCGAGCKLLAYAWPHSDSLTSRPTCPPRGYPYLQLLAQVQVLQGQIQVRVHIVSLGCRLLLLSPAEAAPKEAAKAAHMQATGTDVRQCRSGKCVDTALVPAAYSSLLAGAA